MKGRDSYCVTYHDAIIMRLNKDKYQITAPLDNRKHRNVGVVRSQGLSTAAQAVLAGVYDTNLPLDQFIWDVLAQWEKPEAI